MDLPIGTIVACATQSTPDGWLLCDGSKISGEYSELITALGSTFTPDLRGRVIIGTGEPENNKQSDGIIPNFPSNFHPSNGYTGGEYVHTLSINELAQHDHLLPWLLNTNEESNDWGIYGIKGTNGNQIFTDKTGANSPHNNMQPYIALNFLIYTGK